MKKLLLISTLLLFVGISGSIAAPQGYTGGVSDSDRSNYTAIVKYSYWVQTDAGKTRVTSYIYISATTMASCQQQLNAITASPSASTVQHCYAFAG